MVLDLLIVQIGDQSSEELDIVARCEELRVVLDEVWAILIHVEIFPGDRRVFNRLAIFLGSVGTTNSLMLSVGIITALSLF